MVRGFIYEKSLTMIVSCSQALCMSQWRYVKCTVKKQVRDRGGGVTVCQVTMGKPTLPWCHITHMSLYARLLLACSTIASP